MQNAGEKGSDRDGKGSIVETRRWTYSGVGRSQFEPPPREIHGSGLLPETHADRLEIERGVVRAGFKAEYNPAGGQLGV